MSQVKTGTVVSDKMQNTVVVKIDTHIKHPLYKKSIIRSKKVKARDEIGTKVGQKVKIVGTKPFAKSVSFKILEVLN